MEGSRSHGESSTQVVGLDIGTTKVCALIAEPSETGPPAVLASAPAVARHQARRGGEHRGVRRRHQAGDRRSGAQAGTTVDRAFVGIGGPHVRGINSRGVVAIAGRDHEVSAEDVHRAKEAPAR